LYAYKNELPIILHDPVRPNDVEIVSDDHSFDFLLFDKVPTYAEVWDRLVFVLGMGGLMVVPDMIQNLRHDSDKKSVTIVTKQSSRFIVEYQELMKLDLK
jgi:predicted O-methyltransferase YrrM